MTDKPGSLEELSRLEATISARASESEDVSYTAKLLAGGVPACARKFGEESIELILAAMENDSRHVVAESADVLYHLLVLLKSKDIGLGEVMAELKKRSVMSGLEEKASRQKG